MLRRDPLPSGLLVPPCAIRLYALALGRDEVPSVRSEPISRRPVLAAIALGLIACSPIELFIAKCDVDRRSRVMSTQEFFQIPDRRSHASFFNQR